MLSKSLCLLFILFAAASAIPTPSLPVTVAPDCSTVSCLLPVCKEGEVLVVPKGECCPQCVPDCSAISCLLPVCEKGEKLVVPEGECCPKCVPDTPDCSAVLCLRPVCEEGQKLIVPDGECCPKCVPDNPDCSAVFCLQPVCEGGEELVVPDGECCPRCQPVCTVKGQTFSSCASRCPRICNSPPVFCPAVCVEGCTCPSGQLIDTINNRCVSEDKCPSRASPICSLTPESGPCEAAIRKFFYNSTTDKCEPFIYGGCEGNGNRFDTRSECISTCGADNPCIGVSCQRGSTCKVDDETGEAFCDPSCELDNGGCQSDEICELQIVQCVRAPCPPVVNCRPRSKRSSEKDCPPTCSVEFCSKNRTAQCSNPGPREIPGCTGSCQLTYCHACYSSEEFIPRPESCPTCRDFRDYLIDSTCFRQWADCISKSLPLIRPDASQADLKCFNPPCPLRG